MARATSFSILLLLRTAVSLQQIPANGSHYDYIIVGGGTCGLVVANRLSEDPSIKVAVIEAGDTVRNNPNVTNTTAYGLSLGTSIDWAYPSLPQQYANNKSVVYHAGKALGGTSTINGMTYIRPDSAEIDLWEELGNEGWNWSTLFAFAKFSEAFEVPQAQQVADGANYDPSAHGHDGPLDVSFNPHLTTGNLHSLFNETWQSLGIPYIRDNNAGMLRGFTLWPQTLDARSDVREDAARAYYYPVEDRSNLHTFLNTTATRVLWADRGSKEGGLKTDGVEILATDGSVLVLYADQEVVLSAGSLKTPILLERSGVGNPDILVKHSIEPVINLPSVGENLQDQTNVFIYATSNQTFSGYPAFVTYATITDLFGANTSAVYQQLLSQLPDYAAAIAQASSNSTTASIQETLLRTQVDLLFNKNVSAVEFLDVAESTATANIVGCPFWGLLPLSRGSVHIASTNINDSPAINPNFFQFDFDGKLQVAAARLMRKALEMAPLDSVVITESAPGLPTVPADASDDVWLDWMKDNYSSNLHPVGTAAMLPQSLGGVVDPTLKVYNTTNLRVVDASVLPFQVGGHLTSTLYAVAERASDLIKAGRRKAEEDVRR